ncbi:hypothetical protein HBB16_07290 [Pseudonocardia sp. MCCB 268]|nr:hypothetical protein [Pseudonocardia cytotoxica]
MDVLKARGVVRVGTRHAARFRRPLRPRRGQPGHLRDDRAGAPRLGCTSSPSPVETAAQAGQLRSLGCDVGQGVVHRPAAAARQGPGDAQPDRGARRRSERPTASHSRPPPSARRARCEAHY